MRLTLLILTALFSASVFAVPQRQLQTSAPRSLVADLYRQHERKHSPFFQTRSRALLNRYFTRELADLIWKDRINSKGEVGALDGDPLYNAQDIEIKNFKIGQARLNNGAALVPVSFLNFGKEEKITFRLVSAPGGWKIANIEYQDGTSLAGILRGQ